MPKERVGRFRVTFIGAANLEEGRRVYMKIGRHTKTKEYTVVGGQVTFDNETIERFATLGGCKRAPHVGLPKQEKVSLRCKSDQWWKPDSRMGTVRIRFGKHIGSVNRAVQKTVTRTKRGAPTPVLRFSVDTVWGSDEVAAH
jgi:hypothetical protein